jgi:archaellum biogenesis ATPase FlaH
MTARKAEHPRQAENKVTPPAWDDIGKKKVSPPGPLAEVATELADREVARLLVNAVVSKDTQSKSQKRAVPATGEVSSLAKLRRFSAIEPEMLRWLWTKRIPLGKLTLFAGDPGLGKSLLTLDAAARVSRGTSWPDGEPCEPGDTIILSAEDDAADTIRPRLDAAGADVSRVHLLEAVRVVTADGKSVESGFSLERDISALEDALKETHARLVSIDPISAYLGATDSHANAEVRGVLSPVAALAAKYGAAVIAVTHLRKSAGAAIYRAMGSLAFAAAARAVWGIIADPDDKARRLFVPVKMNLAPDGGGLAYRIEAASGTARVVWESGAVVVDVNAAMGGFETPDDHTARRAAEEWLRECLSGGLISAAEVMRAATLVGIKRATLYRAADSLGVSKRKVGGRGAGWLWVLKDTGSSKIPPPHTRSMESLSKATETEEIGEVKGLKDSNIPMVEPLESVESLTRFEEGEV